MVGWGGVYVVFIVASVVFILGIGFSCSICGGGLFMEARACRLSQSSVGVPLHSIVV